MFLLILALIVLSFIDGFVVLFAGKMEEESSDTRNYHTIGDVFGYLFAAILLMVYRFTVPALALYYVVEKYTTLQWGYSYIEYVAVIGVWFVLFKRKRSKDNE